MGKILLRGARQLLTLRGHSSPRRGDDLRELSIIEDGAVLIEDGVIREVGPSRRIERLADARSFREVDATGCVVMPGFVDCHTHLMEEWRDKVRSWTTTRIRSEVRARMARFLRHGTTTVGTTAADIKEARILSALDGHPLDIVTAFEANPAGDVSTTPRSARFVTVRGENGTVPERTARTVLSTARAEGYGLKLEGGGFARLAVEMGATALSHVEDCLRDDLELLAVSSTILPLLPGVSYHRRWRFGPGRRLVDNGAAIALATDFGSDASRTASLPMIVSLACTYLGLSPEEAISAVTINAAHVLGLPRLVGSLESGKQADLVVLDANDYRDLATCFGTNLVKMTMKRGKVLYREQEIEWPGD